MSSILGVVIVVVWGFYVEFGYWDPQGAGCRVIRKVLTPCMYANVHESGKIGVR